MTDLKITELERLYANLERQQWAHGQILERIQARLTDLERAPALAKSERAYFRSELEDEQRNLTKRIDALESVRDHHGQRLDDLESATESEDDEPTGYEGYSDAALLGLCATQYAEDDIDPDLIREATKRRDAR